MISTTMRRCALLSVAALAGLLPLAAHGATKQAAQAPPLTVRFPISAQKPASHYALPLTADVYAAVNRQDLGDLCVRNAAGEALPFALSRPVAPAERRERALAVDSLPWFPMPASRETGSGGPAATLGVVIAPDGSLRAAPGANPASGRRPGEVVSLAPLWAGVEMSAVRGTKLTLIVDIAEPEYQGGLRLLESDDLDVTRPVGDGRLLVLRNERETLAANRLEFSGVRGKYLLLYWDQTPPTVTGIRAELVLEEFQAAPSPAFPATPEEARAAGADPASRQWLVDIPGEKDPAGNVVFRLSAHPPVDFVQLALPRSNTLISGTFSTAFLPGGYRGSASGTEKFFRFTGTNGTETRNKPVAVNLNRDAEWLFRPEGVAFEAETPRLSVSWQPDTLTFTASGDGPYTLSTGCAGAGPRALSALYPDEVTSRTAEPARLGAGERFDPEPVDAGPTDTRRLVLWGVLLLGLGFLGFMAYRLARGQNKQ